MDGEKNLADFTDEEYRQWVHVHMMKGWMPMAMYLRAFPGETAIAIQTRVSRGAWKRGVHYARPAGSGPWVNLLAVAQWLADATGTQEE